jgi:hypothetical protein
MQSARRKLPRSKTSGINGLRHYSFRPRREPLHNRALRIIRKDAQHLGESAARGVERLLVQKQVDASGLELTQKGDEVL